MGGFAWVTLATNDSYSLGALVLAHSLKQVGTAHQLAVLVTPGVTGVMREKLATVFNVVKEVNILDSQDEANLRLLKRPELGITFTKLHCWRLTQYEKCVFLDADTMVLANADELFDREEFSAAPDVGWPDCFNSGVFVYRPSEDTYSKLVQFAVEKGSFDGGDQGLLNLYFSDWAHKDISKHLPFIYNMCSTACYSYLPAFKQFGPNVKIIHFIGNTKPWLQYFDSETQHVQVVSDIHHLQGVVQQWWNIFCSCIHPMLAPEMAGLAGAFARLTLGVARTPEQAMLEDQLRRQGWEVGNIDYMGRDSFDNIWSKICETLNAGPPAYVPPPPADLIPAAAVEPVVTKQVVSEPTQEPITKDLEQKTVVEKEPQPSAPVTEQPKPVTPASPQIDDEPKAVPVPQTAPILQTVVPLAPESSAPTEPTAPEPRREVPAPEPAVSAPQPTVPAPQPDVPTPQPAVTAPQPDVAAPQSAVPTPQLSVTTSQSDLPAPQPDVAAPQSIVPTPQPPVTTPQPAVPVPSVPQAAVAPAPKPTVPVSQTEAVLKSQSSPQQAVQPPKAVPQQEPPKQVISPSEPPVTKQVPTSEPPKQQPPKPTVVPKQPESPKPAPAPTAKPKKESIEKPASPQAGEIPKPVTESAKPSVNIPKPAAEQAAGQRAAPQSLSPKEGAQSKPDAPSAEGPTPPPRKAASAQAAAGGKKPAKGKK